MPVQGQAELLDVAGIWAAVRGGRFPMPSQRSAIQPYRPEDGVRIPQPAPGIDGYTDLVRFSDEFYLVVSDARCHRETTRAYMLPGWVTFHFRVSGESRVELDSGTSARKSARCYVACYPEEFVKRESALRDPRGAFKSVAILMRPTFVREHFGSHLPRVSEELSQFIDGRHNKYWGQCIRFDREIRHALCDCFTTRMTGEIRWQFSKAKAMELACRAMQALVKRPETASGDDLVLRPRDCDRLHQARAFIEARLTERYTIHEIARHVGLNRRKLATGFTVLFGTTVFEFGRTLRMQRAAEYLREDQLNIGEISPLLGYENPRNFSVAFLGHYGMLPKDYRARTRREQEESETAGT